MVALGATACAGSGSAADSASDSSSTTTTTTSGNVAIPTIVRRVGPSVVTVITDSAEGSGVIWSANGRIVTNRHVVAAASSVQVQFADGSRAGADVVAVDALSDLAVLKVGRTGLPPATFTSNLPPVGSLAVAIGNPLGFENTVTAGIVSGEGRAIPGGGSSLVDLLQTDAPISPGNSGGALVGADGKVIGINVAYIPPTSEAVSLGFAIPSSTVTDVVRQLLRTGTVRHAYLGVQVSTLTPQIANELGAGVDTGAVVVQVTDPARQAGVRRSDIIVGVGSTRVRSASDMLAVVDGHAPGDSITLRIVRAGKRRTVDVTLVRHPA